MNGIPKGIIKQFLGYVPIMVKSKLCNLYNLPPRALIEHHEEAEVMAGASALQGQVTVEKARAGSERTGRLTVAVFFFLCINFWIGIIGH